MKAGRCAISNLADITPELLLRAYAMGIFPMADTADSTELHWYSPDPRAILPLHPFHAPKSLRKLMRHTPYQVRVDTDFSGVIDGCAEATATRPETWINTEIKNLLVELHHMGFAHSVECYDDTGQLIGGLYGVALGAAFFGESMFSRKSNASKLCLLHLFERLEVGGYTLLDSQFVNPHLIQFGVMEIARDEYLQRLATAIKTPASWQRIDQL